MRTGPRFSHPLIPGDFWVIIVSVTTTNSRPCVFVLEILIYVEQLLGVTIEDGSNLVVRKDRRESLIHYGRQGEGASWRGEDGVAAVQELVGTE